MIQNILLAALFHIKNYLGFKILDVTVAQVEPVPNLFQNSIQS